MRVVFARILLNTIFLDQVWLSFQKFCNVICTAFKINLFHSITFRLIKFSSQFKSVSFPFWLLKYMHKWKKFICPLSVEAYFLRSLSYVSIVPFWNDRWSMVYMYILVAEGLLIPGRKLGMVLWVQIAQLILSRTVMAILWVLTSWLLVVN